MKKIKIAKAKRVKIYKWSAIVLGIAAVLALILPLPLYAESPGEALGLQNFIKVEKKKPKIDGEFMITAVYLQQVNGIGAIIGWLDPKVDIETSYEVNGDGTSEDNYKINQVYMATALNEAKAVAYKAAGITFVRKFNGIYVMAIQQDSNFKKYLHVGDTITKIDGKSLESTVAIQKYIRSRKIGHALSVTYKHNGKTKTVTAKTVKIQGTKKTPGIGIALTDNVTMKSDTKVSANMGDIGGPSGGLMFSLEIYDALSPVNLANGRKIAGTGTIDKDGNVGEIGGIDKKVIVAGQEGAKIFFAPYVKPTKAILKYEDNHMTNYQSAKQAAKKYAPNMKIVPVKNFKEAVKYLETHQ